METKHILSDAVVDRIFIVCMMCAVLEAVVSAVFGITNVI